MGQACGLCVLELFSFIQMGEQNTMTYGTIVIKNLDTPFGTAKCKFSIGLSLPNVKSRHRTLYCPSGACPLIPFMGRLLVLGKPQFKHSISLNNLGCPKYNAIIIIFSIYRISLICLFASLETYRGLCSVSVTDDY